MASNPFTAAFNKKMNLNAGGNSTRGFKEIASDMLNNMDAKDTQLSDMTGLSATTIARIKDLTPAESGRAYAPQSDTLERVFRGGGFAVVLTPVVIKTRYQNKPKED